MTRQFSPEEVAELQARIEAANKELLEAEQAAEEQLKLKFSQLLKLLLSQYMRKDLKMMLTLNKNQF